MSKSFLQSVERYAILDEEKYVIILSPSLLSGGHFKEVKNYETRYSWFAKRWQKYII